MRKEYFIIAGILLIASITISILIPRAQPQPPQNELAECRALAYNGENKINILFFSDEKTAKEYSDFLLEIKPFSKNKNAFNFYYLNIKPKCELYKNIAILCSSKDLIKKAGSCPNDYIIAIESRPSKIRSSSFMNIISINSNHPPTVLTHEFGHAFANLADEYVPAEIPAGSKNCVTNCEKFNSLNNDCESGCSKENYFRSIKNGIMRVLSSNEFGNFDESLITEKIDKTASITGHAIQEIIDCSKQKYYLIEGNYENEKITIKEISVEIGCASHSGSGDYTYNLTINPNKEIIQEFNPELIFTDAPGEVQINGEVFQNQDNFFLAIPKIDQAETLEIIKQGNPIIKINLKKIGAKPCKN